MADIISGKIIKGIGGFYYIDAEDGHLYECKAKGIFRNKKIKPLVGDNVNIEILDPENNLGNIVEILPRFNSLIRPAVANVDQALVIFAAASPKPNLNLLDRFLISMEQQHIPVVICFNKADLSTEQELAQLEETYRGSGCEVHILSVAKKEGIEKIQSLLNGKTTVVAGPSGVGKSSLTNLLQPHVQMEVGEVSRKIERGRHTTRRVELYPLPHGFLADTPGFSLLDFTRFDFLKPEELPFAMRDFRPYLGQCRYKKCTHTKEEGCAVLSAVRSGEIAPSRHAGFLSMYEEMRHRRNWS